MTTIEPVISKGQLVKWTFMQSDAAASQTDVVLPPAEVRDTAAGADDQNAADGYAAPFDGELVAIAIRASTDRTAGTLTVEALLAGVAAGLTAVLDGTNLRTKVTKMTRGSKVFSAGTVIGAKVTTAAGWTPTTADFVVEVWAILYVDGV